MDMVRGDADFHEILRCRVRGDSTYHLFQRKGAFGGWELTTGLAPFEGPYPQWGLPIVRWALGRETKLAFSSDTQQSCRMLLDCRSHHADQCISITVNGKLLQQVSIGSKGGEFHRLELQIPAKPGMNEVLLGFTHCDDNPQRPAATLFRRLSIDSTGKL
jgi:hypothetical protein